MIDIPLDKLIAACERAQKSADYEGRLHLSMERIGKHAVSLARMDTPTVSGTLKGNWSFRVDGRWIIIHNNTKYAAAWNYGHKQEVGRFVPAIGKRLVKPYVVGSHVLEKAMGRTVKYALPEELLNAVKDILGDFEF